GSAHPATLSLTVRKPLISRQLYSIEWSLSHAGSESFRFGIHTRGAHTDPQPKIAGTADQASASNMRPYASESADRKSGILRQESHISHSDHDQESGTCRTPPYGIDRGCDEDVSGARFP